MASVFLGLPLLGCPGGDSPPPPMFLSPLGPCQAPGHTCPWLCSQQPLLPRPGLVQGADNMGTVGGASTGSQISLLHSFQRLTLTAVAGGQLPVSLPSSSTQNVHPNLLFSVAAPQESEVFSFLYVFWHEWRHSAACLCECTLCSHCRRALALAPGPPLPIPICFWGPRAPARQAAQPPPALTSVAFHCIPKSSWGQPLP